MEIAALSWCFLLLLLYIPISSIGLGLSVFYAFPTFVSDQSILKKYLNPVFATSDLGFIFFAGSMFLFFPNLMYIAFTYLPIPLILGFLMLVFRAGFLYHIRSQKDENIFNKYIIVGTSFLAPLLLSTAYSFAITGNYSTHFTNSVSILIYALVIISLLLTASTFLQWIDPKSPDRMNTFIHEVSLFFVLFLLTIPPLFLKFAPYMLSNLAIDILALIFIGGSTSALFYYQKMKRYNFTFIASLTCIFSILLSLFLMHIPYLIYPSVSTDDLFTLSFLPMIGGVMFVILGLLVLYHLLNLGKKSHSAIY